MQYNTPDYSGITYFPAQKISTRLKTIDWYKKNIEAAESLTLYKDSGLSKSYANMKSNYNLINDIIQEADYEQTFNPLNLQGVFPAAMQNYDITRRKLDLLIGEEHKRRFEPSFIIFNEDAVSSREKEKKDMLFQLVISQVIAKEEDVNQEQIQNKLKDLEKYITYEYQDIRSLTMQRIYSYLSEEQKLKHKFNRGFYHGLIAAKEIYRTDIVAGNPTLEIVDPLNFFSLRSGTSYKIEDADITVEVSFEPPGKVIDEFHEYLSPKNVRDIEEYSGMNQTHSSKITGYTAMNPVWDLRTILSDTGQDGLIRVNEGGTSAFGGYYDSEGNIRVLRVRWKGKRKIFERTYFDENGEQQKDLKSEYYKAKSEEGETLKELWVSEWYEGIKIGYDKYVKMGQREVQFNNASNPSLCKSGYVGTLYNIGSNQAMSLVDKIKPYQYLYNIFMRRLELALARYDGPIVELDVSKMPPKWDLKQWLYYAKTLGMLVVDSFNVGTEGAAAGKLAGSFNTTNKVINADLGNYIQQLVLLLQFIETNAGKVAGVTEQREGQIDNRETVGGIERAVTQSSHITEPYFIAHDDTKLRAIEALLETAKYAYRDEKNKALPYFLDDVSIAYLKFDGADFEETQFGIKMVDSKKHEDIMQKMDTLVHAGLQTDKLNFSQILDIWLNPSMSSIRRKIEQGEAETIQRLNQQRQEELQANQQNVQAQIEAQMLESEKDRQLKRDEFMLKADIEIAKIEAQQNNTPENSDELEKLKLKMQEMKIQMESDFKKAQLEETKRANRVNEQLKLKQISKPVSKSK